MKNQEQLIIITGPSGVGKGTVVKEILNMNSNKIWLSISATTRNAREGEENGVHYYFLSKVIGYSINWALEILALLTFHHHQNQILI